MVFKTSKGASEQIPIPSTRDELSVTVFFFFNLHKILCILNQINLWE